MAAEHGLSDQSVPQSTRAFAYGHHPFEGATPGSPEWVTRGSGDGYPRAVRVPLSLAAEVLLARAAGRLSRIARRGGGTTVGGKLLATLDPGAIDRLAARLRDGAAVISATNREKQTAAGVAGALAPRGRPPPHHLPADPGSCRGGAQRCATS